MKKSANYKSMGRIYFLLLVIVPVLIIGSCQKEEQLILDPDYISVNQLKSGAIPADNIDNLILKIENYVTSGDLKPGIANSFLTKLSNAKKSLEKGNEKAAINQFNALENQLENLISTGTIDVSIGEELINDLDVILGGWTCGMPFVDPRDGKVYQTVKIGDQCWMAENLAYLPSVSPRTDESITEPYYYVYGYNGTSVSDAKGTFNYNTFGVLYNWEAAKTACPDGWHLPSQSELTDLIDYLGGESIAGEKLKASSGWDGTDDYGFSALPGGYRHFPDIFAAVGSNGYWWSSTPEANSNSNVSFLLLFTNNSRAGFYSGSKQDGFSVRCVKD